MTQMASHLQLQPLPAILPAGQPAGIDRLEQHREQTETIARQHVGEQPVSQHGHLSSGKIQLLDHPPQGTAPRLGRPGGVGEPEAFGESTDAAS